MIGHGSRDKHGYYFCYNESEGKQKFIQHKVFNKSIESIKALDIVAILDFCHSGGFIQNSNKTWYFTSCRDDEFTVYNKYYEKKRDKLSVYFTKEFVRALESSQTWGEGFENAAQSTANIWVQMHARLATSLQGFKGMHPQQSQSQLQLALPNMQSEGSWVTIPGMSRYDGSYVYDFEKSFEHWKKNCLPKLEPWEMEEWKKWFLKRCLFLDPTDKDGAKGYYREAYYASSSTGQSFTGALGPSIALQYSSFTIEGLSISVYDLSDDKTRVKKISFKQLSDKESSFSLFHRDTWFITDEYIIGKSPITGEHSYYRKVKKENDFRHNSSIVGSWHIVYSDVSSRRETNKDIRFNDDGSVDGMGGKGSWELLGSQISWKHSDGTHFRGILVENNGLKYMAGKWKLSSGRDFSGYWHGSKY